MSDLTMKTVCRTEAWDFDRTLDHRHNHSYRWMQPEGREDVLGMGTADLDYVCPPCLKEALRPILEENTYNYRMKPELYFDTVKGWYQRHYGLSVQKDWLTNVPGTIASIRLAIDRFSERGDSVIMQAPYFTPLKVAVEGAGRRLVTTPMVLRDGRYELDLADFEERLKCFRPALFLLVNPHNPTGRVFTRQELESLVELCGKYGVRIISDEVHSHILYDGRKHIPILAVSERARELSIQVVSMCKGFNTMGLPHAIVTIASPQMQKEWEEFLIPFSFHYASNAYSIGANIAVMRGDADLWQQKLNAYLMGNRDLFVREVARRKLPFAPLAPEAGYLMWVDCRGSGLDLERLGEVFLKKAGISLNDGRDHGEEGRGFVRLNFAVTRENLLLAVERMEKILW